MHHVISLGAGVQSSTLALMAAHGFLTPMPSAAIFADTQWEGAATYSYLDMLKGKLPFPVVTVSRGNLREMALRQQSGKRRANPPLFLRNPDGSRGILMRQCTGSFKTEAVQEYIKREVLGLRPKQRAPTDKVVTQWLGISSDEAHRMKPSPLAWLVNRYPLAMELRFSRAQCLRWLRYHGYPEPPRSACIGCPYRGDAEWLEMKRDRPEEWQDAVEFDRAIRHGVKGVRLPAFVHDSLVPLEEAELRNDRQSDLWGEECTGMCGV